MMSNVLKYNSVNLKKVMMEMRSDGERDGSLQIKKFNHFRIYTIHQLTLHSFMCNALLFYFLQCHDNHY